MLDSEMREGPQDFTHNASIDVKDFSSHIRPLYMTINRSTQCDVISVVTTITLCKHGTLKYVSADLSNNLKKMKKMVEPAGLYEEGVENMNKIQLHERLVREHQVFMDSLSLKRIEHSRRTKIYAVKIQAAYRRHLVIKNLSEILESCRVRKHLRQLLIGKCQKKIVISRKRYNNKQKFNRYVMACKIQMFYKKYRESLTNPTLVSPLSFLMKKLATRTQSKRKKSLAKTRTTSMVVDRYFSKHTMIKTMGAFQMGIIYRTSTEGINIAASIIQRMFRVRMARYTAEVHKARTIMYQLRNKSARAIQSIVRGRHTRMCFKSIITKLVRIQSRVRVWLSCKTVRRLKHERTAAIRNKLSSIIEIQRIMRSKVVRMRVGVVRNRLTMFKRFHAATKMQSLVRMFLEGRVCSLARQSLRNKREILANNRLAEMMLQEEARLEREKFEAQVARDIFYQAANGHAAVVDRLFNDRSFSTHSSELDVNEDGETVLLVAARRGFVEIVRRCVWWGFDLNHRNKDDETAVMLAAKNGHEDVVSFLLEMPLNSGKDRTNRAKRLLIKKEDTALMTTSAARLGKSRILKRICEYEGPSRLDSKLPSTGETALHIACELNRIEEIRYLVSQKCSISAPDDHDVTPLMRASASSNQAARIVLGLSEEDSMWLNTLDKETASMVRQRDKDGRDCYIYAALNAQQNTLDMFSKLVPRLHPYNLLGTSDDGHDEVKIRPLVIWRADDCDKVASLIENGCVQCLSRLLEEGFNSNMLQGGSGRSLVSYACEFGQLEALDLLMTRAVNPLDSRGVSLSQVDEAGRNALHYAARCCHQSVIEYVLSHPCAAKCKVDSKLLIALDINGDSALHIAGRHGAHIPLSALTTDEWILGLSVRNNSGMTPLLEACAAQHAAVALHLIKLGADVLAVDSDGRSTLWHLVRPRGGQTDKRDLGLTVLSLLQGGCALYTNEQTHVYDASALRIEDSSEPGDFIIDSVDGPTLAGCRDLIAGESSLLWRLLLSALKFDRKSSYALRAILDKGTVALIGSSLYQGLSLLGWATVLDSRPAVDFLMSYAGIRLDTAVDEDGNTAVHLASRHDLSELLDIMLIKGGGHLAKGVDIPNKLGVTPAVVGAKHGSMRAVKLLHHKYGASARTALDGRYWAWLLALAMKEVRREKKIEARDENEQLRLPIR